HLLARDRQDAVVVLGQQQAFHLAAAGGVDALADQEGRRVLVERDGADAAGDARLVGDRALLGRAHADRLDDRRQVLGGGAAAAADDVDAELRDELGQVARHLLGRGGVDLAVVDVERQAGVGDHADLAAAVLAEEADRLAHVLRAGAAVEADHVDAGQRLQRGHYRLDLGAEEHPAGEVVEDLGLDGDAAAELAAEAVDAGDGGLQLEDVDLGLDDEEVGAPLGEPPGLLVEDVNQLPVGNLRQGGVVGGGEHAGRADRAGGDARALRGGVAVGDAAGDGGGGAVELQRLLGEAPLGEAEAAG